MKRSSLVAALAVGFALTTAVPTLADEVRSLAPLAATKRLALFNKALKAGGQQPISAPPPGPIAKVSPGQTQHGLAWMAVLGPGTLNGGNTPWFLVQPLSVQPGLPPSAQVQMYFPNEAGKVYVLDCGVGAPPNVDPATTYTVKFVYPTGDGTTGTQSSTSDAGHALLSYVAKTTGSTLIRLETVGTAPFKFSGCELTKVN